MDFDEVFATEMDFHAEIQNPWYWRTICRIFNKKECHEVVLKELAFLRMAYDLYLTQNEIQNEISQSTQRPQPDKNQRRLVDVEYKEGV